MYPDHHDPDAPLVAPNPEDVVTHVIRDGDNVVFADNQPQPEPANGQDDE